MKKIDGRTRRWIKDTNKTVIFEINYLGQCGCGVKEKVLRKIELKENQTLDDLHSAIIYQSFNWFDPHLYSFFFDNKPYSKNIKMEYTCDNHINLDPSEGEPNSTDIQLRKLKLKKNQKFLFIFDFGDDHHFRIKVKDFGEVQEGLKYPRIIESIGEAPEQYPMEEDDEEV
ncbi:hypothetical protein DRJ22_03745 [Candidatus Woesearchaeota archaeon]|nr:MAG: hypothetical protein DRJ22_03745 [Candidatus Woesearchaeota archaeon]